MTTVTISKIEYKELKQRADSFERLISTQERLARLAPPIRSRNEIIRQMNNTGRYNTATAVFPAACRGVPLRKVQETLVS
ncbi:MAG TPA: hypothetical protein VJI73_01960 [Candidatus Paceibacterota bacterium]